MERSGLLLHVAVGYTVQNVQLLMSSAGAWYSIWAKRCMLGNCAYAICFDMTTPLDGGIMSWRIILLLKQDPCTVYVDYY